MKFIQERCNWIITNGTYLISILGGMLVAGIAFIVAGYFSVPILMDVFLVKIFLFIGTVISWHLIERFRDTESPRLEKDLITGIIAGIVAATLMWAFDFGTAHFKFQEHPWSPPPKKGYIYAIIDKKLFSRKVSYAISWGAYHTSSEEENSSPDVRKFKGIVLRLEHKKPDSYGFLLKTNGELKSLYQPDQGEHPQEWENTDDYLRVCAK